MSNAPQSALTLVNWNVEWATPRSARFPRIRELIDAQQPDVVCLTEGRESLHPDHGHVVVSEADYGYPNANGERRKVLLWSRNAWRDVDSVGSPDMPAGRFVAGTTETAIGPVRFLGVCIPWRDAHVRSGQGDRKAWEDHTAYLRGLATILGGPQDLPTVVVGDFNQQVPRKRAPQNVFGELTRTFATLDLVTTDVREETGRQLIDHVAVSDELEAESVSCWPNHDGDLRLSDHDGTVVVLKRR